MALPQTSDVSFIVLCSSGGNKGDELPFIILLLTSSPLLLLLRFSSLLLLVLLVICIYLSDVAILRDPPRQLACDSSQR